MKTHFRLTYFVVTLISLFLLLLTIKGERGLGSSLYFQKEKDTKINGPYELSNSNARYALTEAIVEENTFFLNPELAKFATPDVVDYRGKFFSIFTPGVSFIGVPFYFIGKYVSLPQIFTYFSTILAAAINALLIAKISKKLGADIFTSIVSGLTFIFATNALTYSQTFTQHHFSTLVILLAILNTFSQRNFKSNFIFGLLLGVGAFLDIPNIILFLPMSIYIFYRNFKISKNNNKYSMSINLSLISIIFGLIPIIILFGWYNYQTTGSYDLLAQNIGRTHYFRNTLPLQNPASGPQLPSTNSENNSNRLNLPFDTRLQLNGLYILLLSNERSWLYYSPVVLLGLIGFLLLIRNRQYKNKIILLFSIIITNIILYSMFGDPWGGWAFGPRYLIPACALTCIGIGPAITYFRKNILFNLLFLLLFAYSLYINTLGVMTTNAIPPKIEAERLQTPIHYTYQLNQDLVNKNTSSNLFYNLILKRLIPLSSYIYLYNGLICILMFSLLTLSTKQRNENNHQ